MQGMGSIFDLMPSREPTDFHKFIPQGTPEERMREIWDGVGRSIQNAMNRHADEQKREKTSAAF